MTFGARADGRREGLRTKPYNTTKQRHRNGKKKKKWKEEEEMEGIQKMENDQVKRMS